ncbi:hypothetical protein FTX61_07620 [Nitriliruptoraceae bacterium ZYF776]|nr:hypothetical protein [Profundirhabdus halotolerans]
MDHRRRGRTGRRPPTSRALEPAVQERDVTSDLGVVAPVAEEARHVAPGGWRRAVVGIAIGVLAGLAVAAAARPPDRS